MKLTFLGTGTSQGVPMIGCECGVCRSKDRRNKRFRTSAVIEQDGFTILIDCSPDLRSQSLRAGLSRIDAILFTHAHSDHILGIDDLRRFNAVLQKRLPGYGSLHTIERVKELFGYTLDPANDHLPYTRLDLHPIEGPFHLGPFEIVPFELPHGRFSSLGFLFKRDGKAALAYFTDCKDIPPAAREAIHDIPVLVIDALRFTQHPTHLSISESIQIARETAARRAYFIHLTHDVDHDPHSRELPPGIEFAYDELVIEV